MVLASASQTRSVSISRSLNLASASVKEELEAEPDRRRWSRSRRHHPDLNTGISERMFTRHSICILLCMYSQGHIREFWTGTDSGIRYVVKTHFCIISGCMETYSLLFLDSSFSDSACHFAEKPSCHFVKVLLSSRMNVRSLHLVQRPLGFDGEP